MFLIGSKKDKTLSAYVRLFHLEIFGNILSIGERETEKKLFTVLTGFILNFLFCFHLPDWSMECSGSSSAFKN